MVTLVQLTGLSGKLVREALFVLIHHSIVHFSQNTSTTSTNTATSSISIAIYRLDLDAILNRVAYGEIVAKVAEKCSFESADLLLEIMVAGRFKVTTTTFSESKIDALKGLFEEGIIEIVSPEMCQFSTDPTNPISVAVSDGNKRKLDEEALFPSVKRTKTGTEEVFIRFKAKEIIYRYIFTEKIVENVSRRLNSSAGKVIETILSLSTDNLMTSVTFNTFQLSQNLPKDLSLPLESSSSGGGGLGSSSPLLQYLHLICQNFDYLQAQTSLGANAFIFDIQKASRHLRLMLIESFIRSRFGLPSARIFRILLSKKMFEERQISKVAMITSKEVRERLYALLNVGLVQLQEVPKSADHAPSRTIFLWSVPEKANYLQPSKSGLFRVFSSKLIVGLVNLRDLIVLERRKHSQLLEKVERSDVANNLELLSSTEQKQLTDLKKTLKVLTVKIDQVFNEFIIFKEE